MSEFRPDAEITMTLDETATGAVVNNLTTTVPGYALDARQGYVLDGKKLDKSKVANKLTVIEEGWALDARQGKYLDENKLGFSAIANDLETDDVNRVLSAAQGKALAGRTAPNAEKLGGRAPEYYSSPINLLDNSNFKRTVNQRGKTTYSGVGYTIDRWRLWESGYSLTVNEGSITVNGVLFQYIDGQPAGKTFTFFYGNDTEKVQSTVGYDSSLGYYYVSIPTGTWTWAALYEGMYTAETLPPYVPKGYAAELAECQRYYENSWFGSAKSERTEYFAFCYSNLNADGMVQYKQHKRIVPTVTFIPAGSNNTWQIYNDTSYCDVDKVEAMNRNGIDGLKFRLSKSSTDKTTWSTGKAMQANGHWEASADL